MQKRNDYRETYRKEKETGEPEQLRSDKHRNKRHERMQSDLTSDDLRLDYIPHNRYDAPHDNKSDGKAPVSPERLYDRPRDHYSASAEDRKDIEQRDAESRRDRSLCADDRQPERELREGYQKYQRVGAQISPGCMDKSRPYPGKRPNRALRQILLQKTDYLLLVDSEEKARYHREDHPDKDARHRRRERGELRQQLHRKL